MLLPESARTLSRTFLTLVFTGFAAIAPAAAAQDAARAPENAVAAHPVASVSPDTTDTTATRDLTARSPRLTTGMGVGTLSFAGGRTERATSASLRFHVTSWLSAAVAPSLVIASQPGSAGATVTQTGLADVPVELAAEHELSIPLSPSLGLALTTTVPVGDTATGLGAGRTGFAGSAFAGLAPASWFSLHGGAGRSLTAFSVQGALNGSASGWGYAGATLGLPAGFSLGADYDGDIGPADSALGRSTSVAVGVGAPAGPLGSLSLAVVRGLTGPTPTWGIALRVGVDYAGLATAGARSPSQEVVQAFGGGPHGLTTPPGTSGTTPASTHGQGHGSGTTTTHGRSGH